MSDRLLVRNALPLVYVIVVLAGFFVATVLGFLLAVGGAVAGIALWAALSQEPSEDELQESDYRTSALQTARGYRRVTPGRSD